MRMRLGKARKSCGFMMEGLEQRELLSAAVDGIVATDPQPASDIVIAAATTLLPLAAPTGVNITKTFSTSMIVGWTDESASESGHRVERSTDATIWTTAGTVGPNVTSFQDTGLTPDTSYYYRVVAFDFLSELPSDPIAATTSAQSLQVSYGDTGLSNITYNGTTLLDLATSPKDGFSIYDYKVIKWDGTSVIGQGNVGFVSSWDADTHTLTYNYGWWRVATQYVQDVDRLNLIISVTNTSLKNTLAGVNILPFVIHFPEFPIGYTATAPQVGYNIDGPTAVPADWQSGMLVAANDDVVRPLYVGLFTSPDTAATQKYLYWVGSTPFWSQPPNWTKFDRPVAPGGSDQYTVSLRFGPSGATAQELAPDVFAAAQAQYPYQLNWTDRRPIGSIHVAATGPSRSATNPRGYLNNPYINVFTKRGLSRFRRALLASADQSIATLQAMNAQGMIVWDLEGEQYSKLGYVGDPRVLLTLAPEMESQGVVDEYFKKFTDAGLRVGVTIRGQHLVQTKTGWKQVESANPYAVMASKIAYARTHWGATLFYIDSNALLKTSQLYDASIFKRLADRFPDILLIPEHENARYYASTAPYAELRLGTTQTPDSVLQAYPSAFSVICTMGGDVVANHDQLVAAVRQGNILMFYGWFNEPQNAAIKSIYDEALLQAP